MAKSISTKSAAFAAIMSRKNAIRKDAMTALSVHGSDVRRELDIINNLDHRVRSQYAAAFAILSPQAQFDDNVRATPVLIRLLERYDDLHPTARTYDLCTRLRGVGFRMVNDRKASQYIDSRDVITQPILGLYTFDTLIKRKGFGPKTASMALALYDEYNRVMTLDTWMLNGLLGLYTKNTINGITWHATKSAYVAIANMLLAIADELNVSPFLLQWSMWCYYRNDTFESHLPIFGL